MAANGVQGSLPVLDDDYDVIVLDLTQERTDEQVNVKPWATSFIVDTMDSALSVKVNDAANASLVLAVGKGLTSFTTKKLFFTNAVGIGTARIILTKRTGE